jgi:hypothetical protein
MEAGDALPPAPVPAGATAATPPDFPGASAIVAGPAVANQLRSRPIVDRGGSIGSTAWGVANAREGHLVGGGQRARELDTADAAEDSPANEEPVGNRADDQSDEGEKVGHI